MSEVNKVLEKASLRNPRNSKEVKRAWRKLIAADALCQLLKNAAKHDCITAIGSVTHDDVWKKVHHVILTTGMSRDIDQWFTTVQIPFDWNDPCRDSSYETETMAFIDALHDKLQEVGAIP
jgi:hypothetical protein